MDPQTRRGLQHILTALEGLSHAIRKGVSFGIHEGSGHLLAKQYRGLYQRALRYLPDDSYLQEFLALDSSGKPGDEEQTFQVMVICDQLILYLQSLLEDDALPASEGSSSTRHTGDRRDPIKDATKEALRRALADVEDLDTDPSQT